MEMKTATQSVERLPGRWLGLAALSLSGLVLGLDMTILVTALPTLSARLGATTDQLQWMSAGYTLSLAGLIRYWWRHREDRRWVARLRPGQHPGARVEVTGDDRGSVLGVDVVHQVVEPADETLRR